MELLENVARALQVPREEVPARAAQLVNEVTELRRRLDASERKSAQQGLSGILDGAERMESASGAYQVVIAELDAESAPTPERLREAADWLRDKLPDPSVVLLASVIDGRPQLLAAVAPGLTQRGVHAGKLLQEVAAEIGGRGGGRPEMAQGGGGDAAKLTLGFERARRLLSA